MFAVEFFDVIPQSPIALDQVAQTLRPSLTVIRDSQLKSIEPTTVVAGDLFELKP